MDCLQWLLVKEKAILKMMSKKQWFVLLGLFIIYLLLGASIFFYVEAQEEIKRNNEDSRERQIIQGEF
ncbi:hypothetical protein JTB14_029660 [Gonioctena quinquepunctata]|nr:hypothetical protein JTB14_029660 [Gonioctena quinquepunctata]